MPSICPNSVVFNILGAISNMAMEQFQNPNYGQIMPFMDCSQDEFQNFKANLYILQSCLCITKEVKVFEDTKAAVIIETSGGASSYGIFLLRKKDRIWKVYYVSSIFGHPWNWDNIWNA